MIFRNEYMLSQFKLFLQNFFIKYCFEESFCKIEPIPLYSKLNITNNYFSEILLVGYESVIKAEKSLYCKSYKLNGIVNLPQFLILLKPKTQSIL